jgi:hypothetical protein
VHHPNVAGGDEGTQIGDSGSILLRFVLDGLDVQPGIEGTTNFTGGSKSTDDNPLPRLGVLSQD